MLAPAARSRSSASARGLRLWRNLRCAALNWTTDRASTTGAALAFYCAFSLAPLLVIVLACVGWIVGETAAYSQIGAQLQALFGPSTSNILLTAMKSSQHSEGLVATIGSVVTLLVGATTVLAALESALETIWQTRAPERSGWVAWVRTRFISLGFILTLGFLLLISLTLSAGVASVRARYAAHHSMVLGTVGALDIALSLGMVAILFALIFQYMPARRLPWTVVAMGGLLTAVMFDIGRWAVGIYLNHSTQPSAFGAASSFATLLLWLYYTAQIFLFGAEFTACLGGIRHASGTGDAVKEG